MRSRYLFSVIAFLCVVSMIAWRLYRAVPARAQQSTTEAQPTASQPPQQTEEVKPGDSQSAPAATFHAQTKLVLVDSIVTDKKGNYIRDLAQKDFRVWEDNKEQEVKSFSYESQTGVNGNPPTHYLVLFFDNSSMEFGDQSYARQTATKFIDANAGPNHLIALVDFGGTLRITQNFTADSDRLKKIVAGTKFSTVSPNGTAPVEVASAGVPPLMNAEAEFGARSMLMALRALAKNLATVPGRKSVVLLTAGFPLTPEDESELTAVIDSCNKANVAVYPVDVRGLVAGGPVAPQSRLTNPLTRHEGQLRTAVFNYSNDAEKTPHLVLVQRPGGGGGGGVGGHGGAGGGGAGGGGTGGGHGGTGGGGTGGHGGTGGGGTGHGGTGGTGSGGKGGTGSSGGRGFTPSSAYYNNIMNPNLQPRNIVPQFPESASTNQQVLFALADGTGGFVIHDTNDLLSGMDRIAKEQDEYYVVGYAPPESQEGSCHTIKVKIDRGGTIVRSRSGYCNVKPVDLLAGKPIEKELESHASMSNISAPGASLETPFFFTSANVARVSVAMEIPSNTVKFDKQKGKYHADINVLGIATKPDGTEAARFSDTVHLELEKDEVKEFNKNPFRYENQFDVASGEYKLAVVFSSGGESFGKLEAPLKVDNYDGKHFVLSSLALSREAHPVADIQQGLDADLIAGYVPLVTAGIQIVPAADYHFKKTEATFMYAEIYEPLLTGPNPPKIGVEMKIVDEKTGRAPIDAGITNTEKLIQAGNPVVPFGLKVPVDKLDPGNYRLELRAIDSAGNSSPIRATEFVVD